MTVFSFDEQGPVDLDWVTLAVREYSEKDDVFRPEFLQAVLFLRTSGAKLSVTEEAITFLRERGATTISTHQAISHGRKAKPGPYYYSAGILRPIWRLYGDTHGAFLQALIPDGKG